MNYIEAMQHLTKYREDKRAVGYALTPAYNYVEKLKGKLASTDGFNKDNIVKQSEFMLEQLGSNSASRLGEDVKSGCSLLEIEYTEKMRGDAATYEARMLEIQRSAREEIQKGVYKPITDNAPKLMGVIMLSIFALALTFAGLSLSMPSISLIGLGCGAIAISIATKKTKPDEAVLSSLVSEAKNITKNYYSELVFTFEKAYADFENKKNNELNKNAEQIKAMVGERVFFLFENTPYGQQEYFIQLGMTATSEEDFNSIAKECIIADKTQHQIDVQNMINIETRNSINKKLDELNRTTKQMHEDAEFRARQQANHNAEIAKQNERNLANQRKALDEMKKAERRAEDFEYHMRHR